MAFGAVMFAFLPLLLAAVFGWVREAGASREWAWLAAAMVASAPTVVEVAGSGYVDLALALYVALAIRALARWSDAPEPSALVLLCLLLACALAIKLTAGFVVLFCALVVLLRSRATGSDGAIGHRRLVAGLAALAGAIALGSPWYLRTWVRTGSPVFPFFAHILPGRAPGWDPERSAMLVGFNAHYGGVDKGPLDYLFTPLSLSVAGHREVAAAYEGVLGAAFLLGAVLVVWAFRRLGAPLRLVALAAGAFFLWWLASAQVLRYLFPALPLLAVATAGAGAALAASTRAGGMLRWALAAPVAAGAVVTAVWLVADNPLLVAAGAEPRAAYLERRLEHYPYYRVINASLPRDATVWLVNVRRDTYHLERALHRRLPLRGLHAAPVDRGRDVGPRRAALRARPREHPRADPPRRAVRPRNVTADTRRCAPGGQPRAARATARLPRRRHPGGARRPPIRPGRTADRRRPRARDGGRPSPSRAPRLRPLTASRIAGTRDTAC